MFLPHKCSLFAIVAFCFLGFASSVQAIMINWQDNAHMLLTTPNEDEFIINGLNGQINLVDNTPTAINILGFVYSLGFEEDNQIYTQNFTHALTINGISNNFEQTYTVTNSFFPEWSVSSGGISRFILPGGTLNVSIPAVALNTHSFMSIPATVTFMPNTTPPPTVSEPALLALLGLAIISFIMKRHGFNKPVFRTTVSSY